MVKFHILLRSLIAEKKIWYLKKTQKTTNNYVFLLIFCRPGLMRRIHAASLWLKELAIIFFCSYSIQPFTLISLKMIHCIRLRPKQLFCPPFSRFIHMLYTKTLHTRSWCIKKRNKEITCNKTRATPCIFDWKLGRFLVEFPFEGKYEAFVLS